MGVSTGICKVNSYKYYFFCLKLQCNIQRRCSHRTSCFESFCPDFFCYFFCLSIPILICDINRSLIIIQNRRGRCRQKNQWNLFCIQSLHLLIHMRLWICYDDSIRDNAFPQKCTCNMTGCKNRDIVSILFQ